MSGVLLYAKTDEKIIPDNDLLMSRNNIHAKSLDLNKDFKLIKKQLNTLLETLVFSWKGKNFKENENIIR